MSPISSWVFIPQWSLCTLALSLQLKRTNSLRSWQCFTLSLCAPHSRTCKWCSINIYCVMKHAFSSFWMTHQLTVLHVFLRCVISNRNIVSFPQVHGTYSKNFSDDEIERCLLLGRKVMTNLDSICKSRDITLPTKVRLVKAMVFPMVMCGCESWTVKKAEHQRIDTFELWCWEKTLESPLDCKEIQPVHPKGDQCWVFIGRTDAEVETPVLWPLHAKSWLIGKDPDAGMDWGQEEKGTTGWDGWMASPIGKDPDAGRDWGKEEKGTTEDEMAGWHHRLDGCEFEWTLGVGDVGLACCSPWGYK